MLVGFPPAAKEYAVKVFAEAGRNAVEGDRIDARIGVSETKANNLDDVPSMVVV